MAVEPRHYSEVPQEALSAAVAHRPETVREEPNEDDWDQLYSATIEGLPFVAEVGKDQERHKYAEIVDPADQLRQKEHVVGWLAIQNFPDKIALLKGGEPTWLPDGKLGLPLPADLIYKDKIDPRLAKQRMLATFEEASRTLIQTPAEKNYWRNLLDTLMQRAA